LDGRSIMLSDIGQIVAPIVNSSKLINWCTSAKMEKYNFQLPEH